MQKISILIPAYNESANILKLLKSIKNQVLENILIEEILIVDSGSTDKTFLICKKFKLKNPKLNTKIFKQSTRKGKSNAINFLLNKTKSKICVLSSADLIMDKNCLQNLCQPLTNPLVAMTGAHTISTENPKNLLGFFNTQLWLIHNQIAQIKPKCGELIAFKKLFKSIPQNSPVDEASIENIILGKNLQIIYCKNAIVYNSGAKTLSQFINQRTRINFGHLWLKKNYGHTVSTNNLSILLTSIIKTAQPNPAYIIKTALLIITEIYCKIKARIDYYIFKKNYTVWTQIKGSKKINTK